MIRAIRLPLCLAAAATLAAAAPRAPAQEGPGNPAYWKWSPTPPMGWNSYDSFGDSVTEAEVMANAQWMRDHLLAHGYDTVVIDYRWYDPGAHSSNLRDRAGADLSADLYGRLQPAPNRFPSAAGGLGFRPLADRLHAMGLKFGIHVMRGIPRQAVAIDAPIQGTRFRASDAANTASTCHWSPDMYGVRGDTPAGQAWYDSIFRLYAAWGVDYVKVDDLSAPYSTAEVEAIRRAIDRCGRPIIFSLSPGPTPLSKAGHAALHANLWRISGDFWDRWSSLDRQFDLLKGWLPYRGPGHWPDADMIPLGHISIRCSDGGPSHWTRFTRDEQRTLLSLWCLEASPLMLGMNLPDNDAWTESVLENDEVIALDQDPSGRGAVPILEPAGEAWVKTLSDGSIAVGCFDRDPRPIHMVLGWPALGVKGRQRVRDLWRRADLGSFQGSLPVDVPSHGAVLLRFYPAP